MARRNWGLITTGATFEALATTIVFFEDPKAALFGRRGKDGGQDARSGDETRVFQAKHHEDGSSAKAISDAGKEAAKILDYRKPGHARHDQWKGVTNWRLVTNALFNPTDRQTWADEVVPLFAAQGLTADYWERANLDALLDRHPEVDRSFFGSETRSLLSLPEIRDRLPREEPFLKRPELGKFFGRERETSGVRDFLASNELFLVVHGAGGMGKTRLLVEAGELIASEGIWQVLWANVASMEATSAWFGAIVPEHPTLLLVDEPRDEQLLQQLAEQLGGRLGRAAMWKVAVAVRSPKDPVLRFLRGPRMKPRVRELVIAALPHEAAEAMCTDLLGSGALATMPDDQRRDAARELARRFARQPVWLTLAVHVLESRGDLSEVPATAEALADSYLDEIVGSQQDSPAEQVLALLRWVALLGTVNRTDDASVKLIGDRSAVGDATQVRSKLAGLVARRALVERGANNRLVELKPDVLRDRVLMRWLSVNVGYGDNPIAPSADAKVLVSEIRDALLAGSVGALGRAVLVSLGRTELILRLAGSEVPLLDEFFRGMRSAIGAMWPSQRIALADVLVSVAMVRPVDTVSLIAAMRSSVATTELGDASVGTRTLGHDDVILRLAWPLFHAAMGAQTPAAQRAVLGELGALVEAEADLASRLPRGLANDGQRAAALLTRTLEGGPDFWGDFGAAAEAQAEVILTEVARTSPMPGKAALLAALVQPTIAMERRQMWSDDRAFQIQTYSIVPGQPAWKTREAVLARIKGILANGDTPVATRIALWKLIGEAHRSIGQCRSQGPESLQAVYVSQLREDLNWALGVLASRRDNVEELTAARDLWMWHCSYDTDEALKAASDQLEAMYAGNELVREFEPLLSHDEWEQMGPRCAAKAAELAGVSNPAEIDSFIDRAIRFMGTEKEVVYRLSGIAADLGTHAPAQEVVRAFVTDALGQASVSPRTDFGTVTAGSWVARLRRSDSPTAAHRLVVELMRICGSDDQRLTLVLEIYGALSRPRDIGDLTREEHDLLRGLGPMFLSRGRGPEFIAAAGVTLHHEWDALRAILEEVLNDTPGEQVVGTVRSLVNGVYRAVHGSDSAATPSGLGPWLLEQVWRLPDLSDLGVGAEWHLEEILKTTGRAPASWLPGALTRRRILEGQARSRPVRAVGYRARLNRYVARIIPSDVEDADVVSAVRALVDFGDDSGSVGHYLPEICRDIDPEGLMIPTELARRVSGVTAPQELRRLARIGGGYAIGSAPWRAIAKPVIARAMLSGGDEWRAVFARLADRGMRSWSGTPGEVPAIFRSAVESGRSALDSETDAEFRPFWEWRLAVAEAELRGQEEQAKEERGE